MCWLKVNWSVVPYASVSPWGRRKQRGSNTDVNVGGKRLDCQATPTVTHPRAHAPVLRVRQIETEAGAELLGDSP